MKTPDIVIADLSDHLDLIPQLAELVQIGFQGMTDSWEKYEDALEEVQESLEADRVSLVALTPEGEPLGWIGGIKNYPHAWELHPLVVHPDAREQGIGAALVLALEARLKELGARTIYLGTDDENNLTSLNEENLFPDPWPAIARIHQLPGAPIRHPYGFYQKMGYAITGIIPDASGPGKPDIIMTKVLA